MIFGINYKLTSDGLQNYEDVIVETMQYLQLVYNDGISAPYYEEMN
jgi:secreted Zn-dependent insulinase-like peptidase